VPFEVADLAQLREHLLVALQVLDGVVALQLGRHFLRQVGLEVRDERLEVLREAGRLRRLAVARGHLGRGHDLVDALALQRRDLDDRQRERLRKRGGIDLVTALAHDVHLVQSDHYGHAELHELRRQVQVALKVRRVDDINDNVRLALDQIIARDDLLVGIRRQRVDARQVHDLHLGVGPQLARLAFHGNARPVAHVLVVAGELVEQGGLARIGVANQRDRH